MIKVSQFYKPVGHN